MARGNARRVLATVLFTDIVDSSRIATEMGDRRWKALLGRHHDIVRRELRRNGGRELDTAGDGFFASFDSQDGAIRCACAVIAAVQDLGIDVRTGVHAGQAEVVGSKLGGVAVHIGARVMALAGPAEALVTSVVKDLVAGAGFTFVDRGEHVLKGIPGERRIYQVTSVDRPLPRPLDPNEAARRRESIQPAATPGRRLAVVSATAVVVAAVLAGLLLTRHGANPSRAAAPAAHILLKLNPNTGRVIARIPIGLPAPQNDALSALPRLAHAVAVGEGSVWLTNDGSDTVTRVDPVHDRVQATVHVRSPDDVAVVPGGVWVSGDGTPATLINPGDNGPLEIGLPSALTEGFAVAADPDTGAAYIAGESCGLCPVLPPVQVAQIARSTEVKGAVGLGQEFYTSGDVVSRGALWVAAGTKVYRIDLATYKVKGTVEIGGFLGRMAADPSTGSVWVTTLDPGGESGQAVEIDPATNRVVSRRPVGCCPGDIAIGNGFVWVTNSRLGEVQRISLLTGEVAPSIHLARPGVRLLFNEGSSTTTAYGVDGIAVGYGAVWVAVDKTRQR